MRCQSKKFFHCEILSFLKSKAGDIGSLKHIDYPDVVPFVDLISTNAGLDKSALQNKIASLIKAVGSYWDSERPIYIDHNDVSLTARMPDGSHPLLSYGTLLSHGINLGLVTGVDRDDNYNGAIEKLLSDHGAFPIAIRVAYEELEVPRLVALELDELISRFSGVATEILLVLDCRVLDDAVTDEEVVNIVSNFIHAVDVNIFGKVVVASSSVSENLNSYIKRLEEGQITRREGVVWGKLIGVHGEGFLIYGDYGTVSPDFLEITSSGPVPIFPKVTYTLDDYYWIQRGDNTWQHPEGFKQYKELAKNVVNSGVYRGAGFSFGDAYLNDISQYIADSKGKFKTGNATTWITACLSQHISFVYSTL